MFFDFLLDAVAEFNPRDDLWQAVLPVEFAPFLLGGQHQLVGHRQCRLSAEAASQPSSFCQVHPEPVAPALVAAGHFGAGVAKLFLDMALIHFG